MKKRSKTDLVSVDPVFNACEAGDLDFISQRWPTPFDFSTVQNANFETLLEMAFSHGQTKIAQFLIDQGLHLKSVEINPMQLAETAIRYGDCTLLNLLLSCIPPPSNFILHQCMRYSCIYGHIDLIRMMMTKFDADLDNFFHVACEYGQLEVVNLFIRLKVDLNSTGGLYNHHHRPLATAAAHGHRAIVELLLAEGADPNFQPEYSLVEAVENGSHDMVELILSFSEVHPQVLARAVTAAVPRGHAGIVKALLPPYRAACPSVPILTKLLYTALACGHEEVARLLVDAGARVVPAALNTDYLTILMCAAKGGCAGFVSMLISDYGADVNYYAPTGHTALSHASDPATVRVLLDAKADVTHPELMIQACDKVQPESVKLMLAAKATAAIADATVTSPLESAIGAPCADNQIADKVELIKLLIRNGAPCRSPEGVSSVFHAAAGLCHDNSGSYVVETFRHYVPEVIDYYNKTYETALIYAVRVGNIPVVQGLCEAGANANIQDAEGTPALTYALQRWYSRNDGKPFEHDPKAVHKLIEYLMLAGADPGVADVTGRTPIMVALDGECDDYSQYKGDLQPDNLLSVSIREICTLMLSRPTKLEKEKKLKNQCGCVVN
jgi:ankyrin repeat protein